jgi:hypothetical protein
MAVFLIVLFAAVRWALVAHRCIRCAANIWSLWEQQRTKYGADVELFGRD